MKLFFFVALFGATIIFGDEISVFDSIDNANNKNISNQPKQTQSTQTKNIIKEQISDERAEGILSVVEGQNQQIAELKDQISLLQNRMEILENELKNLSKQEIKKSEIKDDFINKNKKEILKEADELYNNKKYKQAKARYEFLAKNNHKPAYCNYKIGEIYYFEKSYAQAIKSYQESLKIYDKAQYTPRLLYHCAISFDKIEDTNAANQFYNALISLYPDSKEAQAAPKNRK